jgi:hypothetical protein
MARALDKKKLIRSMERDLKREHQTRMKQLRADALRLKAERKQRLKAAKQACDANVAAAADRAQREFTKAREAALRAQKAATAARHEARQARKAAARDKCHLDRTAIQNESQAALAAKRAEAQEARRYRREIEAGERLIRGSKPKLTAGQKRARRGEKRGESDDLVRHNLPPELLPIWEEQKRYVKADRHRSRTEVFMDWVHDNPEAAQEAVQRAHQQTPEDWAAAEEAYHRERGMLPRKEEVPF